MKQLLAILVSVGILGLSAFGGGFLGAEASLDIEQMEISLTMRPVVGWSGGWATIQVVFSPEIKLAETDVDLLASLYISPRWSADLGVRTTPFDALGGGVLLDSVVLGLRVAVAGDFGLTFGLRLLSEINLDASLLDQGAAYLGFVWYPWAGGETEWETE